MENENIRALPGGNILQNTKIKDVCHRTPESAEIKELYVKIRNQLFYMIPEKWDKIYLYASVVDRLGNFKTGEMFFYYFPRGILKKNPINSYEISHKFNLEEDEYLKLASKLYDLIKQLKEEFRKNGSRTWNSITIKIERTKFLIEFHYDPIPILETEIQAKHILWAYQNLQMPIESLSKMQRQVLTEELEKIKNTIDDITIYSETMYRNPVKNVVQYNKEKTQYVSEEAVAQMDMPTYTIKTQILDGWV